MNLQRVMGSQRSDKFAARSMAMARRAVGWLLRRDARTRRWARQALSGRRVRWHRGRLSGCAANLERCFDGVSTALEGLAARSSLLLESSRKLLKCSLGQDGEGSV